jgi:adenosylcobinamide amidohydrolase
VIAVRVGRVPFATVAALENPEVIKVHVRIHIEQGVGAQWARLGNTRAQRARPKVLEVCGINVAVVVEKHRERFRR